MMRRAFFAVTGVGHRTGQLTGAVVLTMAVALATGATPALGITAGYRWHQESPGTSPPGRTAPNLAYDATTQTTVLFGGRDPNNVVLNDTWTWSGSDWARQQPATSPPGRYGAGAAYDSRRGVVVVFGGSNGTSVMNDTWVWDGTTWAQKHPKTSPPARMYFGMAWDPALGKVVVFGGQGAGGLLGDTWTWNGRNWAQQSPMNSPSARATAVAYHKPTGEVVLFGGFSGLGRQNDTWTYDAANGWVQQSPATTPPARSGQAMAGAGRVWMFGGYDGTYRGDTWSWSGTDWKQLTSAPSPSGRTTPGLTWDAAHSQVVLFGGFDGNGYPNDTWTLAK